MSELDEILKKYTDAVTGSLHGATFIAIDRKGEEIYAKSFGSRTVDRSEELTSDTLCWTASLTKLATAVSALQVVERGLIGMDDDVRDIIPKLQGLQVLVGWEGDNEPLDAAARDDDIDVFNRGASGSELSKPKGYPVFENIKGKITLRYLLTNSAGLGYDMTQPLLIKWSRMGIFTHYPTNLEHHGNNDRDSIGLEKWSRLSARCLSKITCNRICGSLSAANQLLFFPKKHFSNMPPMQETAFVNPPDAPKRGTWVWTLEPPDAMGGAGLFATANGYSRLLGGILSDESPILKKESINELFEPQFAPRSGSFNALNAYLIDGEKDTHVWRAYPPVALSDVSEYKPQINHGLGGVVVLNDVPGRRKKGSLCWSGLPNLHWWADRESCIAGLMFTQAQPMKSELITNMFLELEAAVYRKAG